MTASPWSEAERRRIDELVLAAAGLEPGDREDVLATESRTDLAAEVRRRLEAADATDDDFLESPLSAFLQVSQDDLPDSVPGAGGERPISESFAELAASERFEIEALLGRGGMAEVYAAFDRRLDRRVALKLLDPSGSTTEQHFLDEARAQARIRHENVLGIYDVGRLGDRPFLAMDLVAGATLTDEAPSLPLEEKIRLVAQAARGLHAAHRRGLIHRDVKPSNILVGRTDSGERKAWVTDFGIAVVSGLADPESGSMLFGTPHYMAPERIHRGDIAVDRRSDVWSLGVTLYQALCGSLPWRAETPLRVLREVQEGRPVPLRERLPTLPSDLVAIVDKCLRPEPGERYPSARALADDLQRFLDGDVVEAHTAGLAYRLTRFAQKHRASLTVACVLAVALLAALVVATGLGFQAMRSERALELRQRQAEGLISFMLGELRERLEPIRRLDVLEKVGDEAMAYFATVPESELSREEMARRSQALYQIGSVRAPLGDLEGARTAFEQSLTLAESLWHLDRDDAERVYGLAQSHFWVGYAHWQAGRLEAAGPHFDRYLDLAQRLAELDPASDRSWLELYYAQSNLGTWQQERGELSQALLRFQQAHDTLTRRIVARDPDQAEWRFELAAAHNSLGLVKRRLGDVEGAAEHLATELEIRRGLVGDQPDDASSKEFLATALQYAASFDLLLQQPERAANRLAEANGLLDELVTHDPSNGDWRHKRTWARSQLSRAVLRLGDVDAARHLAAEAVAESEELASRDPSQVKWQRALAGALASQATAMLAAGDLDAADGAADRALSILRPISQQRPEDRLTHYWTAYSLLLTADAASVRGNLAAAKAKRREVRGMLAPWIDDDQADPDLLRLWLRVLRSLSGDLDGTSDKTTADEIAAAVDRLRSMGLPEPLE